MTKYLVLNNKKYFFKNIKVESIVSSTHCFSEFCKIQYLNLWDFSVVKSDLILSTS